MAIKSSTDVDKEVGTALRNVRQSRGLSREALAKDVGVSYQQIGKYEDGTARMHVSRFLKACEVLEVSAGDMLDLNSGDIPFDKGLLNHMACFNKLDKQQKDALSMVAKSFLTSKGVV